jgi:hypothetical protein
MCKRILTVVTGTHSALRYILILSQHFNFKTYPRGHHFFPNLKTSIKRNGNYARMNPWVHGASMMAPDNDEDDEWVLT